MTEPCIFQDRIIEMSENIKMLVTEFKNQNNTLKYTLELAVKNKSKIDRLWTILKTIFILFTILFGTGIAWKLLR